jgi:hypothetical protein
MLPGSPRNARLVRDPFPHACRARFGSTRSLACKDITQAVKTDPSRTRPTSWATSKRSSGPQGAGCRPAMPSALASIDPTFMSRLTAKAKRTSGHAANGASRPVLRCDDSSRRCGRAWSGSFGVHIVRTNGCEMPELAGPGVTVQPLTCADVEPRQSTTGVRGRSVAPTPRESPVRVRPGPLWFPQVKRCVVRRSRRGTTFATASAAAVSTSWGTGGRHRRGLAGQLAAGSVTCLLQRRIRSVLDPMPSLG